MTLVSVHCDPCAVLHGMTIFSAQCDHCALCAVQASPAVQEGDIGLPLAGSRGHWTTTLAAPCGICIPDIAGADPWHWTLDIGFQCKPAL